MYKLKILSKSGLGLLVRLFVISTLITGGFISECLNASIDLVNTTSVDKNIMVTHEDAHHEKRFSKRITSDTLLANDSPVEHQIKCDQPKITCGCDGCRTYFYSHFLALLKNIDNPSIGHEQMRITGIYVHQFLDNATPPPVPPPDHSLLIGSV